MKSGMRLTHIPGNKLKTAFSPAAARAPVRASGCLRADVLIVMTRRFPVTRLFADWFGKAFFQIDNFHCFQINAIQIFRRKTVAIAGRNVTPDNRLNLLTFVP